MTNQEAWVRFACAAMITEQSLYNTETAEGRADRRAAMKTPDGSVGDDHVSSFERFAAAEIADEMLVEYRKRFPEGTGSG